jgi:UDP-N-acetyl-D-mannosaminuronic acid dehydrogenase
LIVLQAVFLKSPILISTLIKLTLAVIDTAKVSVSFTLTFSPVQGLGAHCIVVDPWFIVARDPENAKLIRTAREVNTHKALWVIDQIKIAVADACVSTSRKPKIARLGLAFKPDIDDLRESPAAQIASELLFQGCDVVAVELNIESHDDFELVGLEEALEVADVLVVLVKHRQFGDGVVKDRLLECGALDFCGVLG